MCRGLQEDRSFLFAFLNNHRSPFHKMYLKMEYTAPCRQKRRKWGNLWNNIPILKERVEVDCEPTELRPDGCEEHMFVPETTRQCMVHVGQYTLQSGKALIIKVRHSITALLPGASKRTEHFAKQQEPKKLV